MHNGFENKIVVVKNLLKSGYGRYFWAFFTGKRVCTDSDETLFCCYSYICYCYTVTVTVK